MRVPKMAKRRDEVDEGYCYGIGDYLSFYTGQKHCYKQLYYFRKDEPISPEYLMLYYKLKRPRSATYHNLFTSDPDYGKHEKQRQVKAEREFKQQIKINKGFL